jgi:hypothetical protein
VSVPPNTIAAALAPARKPNASAAITTRYAARTR